MIPTRDGASADLAEDPTGAVEVGDPELSPRRARAAERRRATTRRRVELGAVAAVVLLGVLLRYWLAFRRLGGLDSDEAITGLMGLHVIRHGEFPAFYWGQQYGGTLDAYLLAPLFWLFGTSTFVLKVPVLVMGAGSVYLTWRIGRRLLRPDQAVVAALLSIVWPIGIVWKETKENGFYSATALLGLAGWLLALQLHEDPRSRWRWAAFGLVIGVAWWESPNVTYFAVPIALWLLLQGHGRRVVGLACAAGGFAAGAGIWIVCNLRSGFASLDVPASWAGTSTYASRFRFFFTGGLPFSLGLRRPWDSAWAFGSTLTPIIYVLVLAVLLALVIRGGIALHPDAIAFLVAPFLFAYFPGNWTMTDGRYLFFVAAILPFLVARLWRGPIPKVAVTGFVVATVVSFIASSSFLVGTVRPTTVPMADRLTSLGYHTAYADYWIAFQMSFESDERVIATPRDMSARSADYVREVAASNAAYVFRVPGAEGDIGGIENVLRAQHIGFRTVSAGAYLAVLPDRRVRW